MKQRNDCNCVGTVYETGLKCRWDKETAERRQLQAGTEQTVSSNLIPTQGKSS